MRDDNPISRIYRETMVVSLSLLGEAPPTQHSFGTPLAGSDCMNQESPKRHPYGGTHHFESLGKRIRCKKKTKKNNQKLNSNFRCSRWNIVFCAFRCSHLPIVFCDLRENQMLSSFKIVFRTHKLDDCGHFAPPIEGSVTIRSIFLFLALATTLKTIFCDLRENRRS